MTLPELIDRLQNAEGPDKNLDDMIMQLCEPQTGKFGWSASPYTASIDAAFAFKGRVLPEAAVDHIGADAVSSPDGYKTIGWTVELINGRRFQGQHQLLPIALVIATLKALAEHEEAGR